MKTKLAQTAAALLLALSLTQAQADVVFEDPPWNQFNQGVNAYTDRDYRRALELLLPLAQSSNYAVRSVAEPYVARIYAIGPEGVKNLREAAYWMHRAAEDGDMSTQYYLGTLYLWGYKDLGIRRDARQAAKWFEQSARQGHEKAAAELALLYHVSGRRRRPAAGYGGSGQMVRKSRRSRRQPCGGDTLADIRPGHRRQTGHEKSGKMAQALGAGSAGRQIAPGSLKDSAPLFCAQAGVAFA